MAAYIKKEGGKRFGSTGGRSAFGSRGGKPNFGRKPFGDDRGGDRPATFYKATCSKCGTSCEVPFKPVNGKPVFCRNCFVKTGDTGTGRAGDRFPKREFQPRSFGAPVQESNNNGDVLKQLEIMNGKLERLILAVEKSSAREE